MGNFTSLTDDDPRSVGGYDLRARIGAGGMGRVYLAFTPGARALAFKVVRPDYAEDDEFRRRFRKEIAAAQRVQGLYTAPVVDADSEAPLPWLATAYVPGPSLHQAVTEHGPLPLVTVFRLLAGVAEGLAAVHACELIHRDLKPANILLAEDGPRVIDFGIAHAADATTLTSTHVRVGTPAFMAPEQIRGRSATTATDVFALGNLTVFAATGRTAFGEGHPEAMFFRIANEEPELDGCDPELRAVVARCLAKEPAERPPVEEVMAYARERIRGETMSMAGGWLPDAVAKTLAGYGTAKYTKPGKSKKSEKSGKKESPTRKTVEEESPTEDTPTFSSGQDHSILAALGTLAVIIFVIVLVVGPQQVLDWFDSDGEQSAAPRHPVPSASSDTGYPSVPDHTQPTDSAVDDTYTDTDTGSDTVEEDTTDPGCEQFSQALSSNDETFDKASAASLSALAVNFDSAADAAEDPDLASAIRAMANDTRSMSDSTEGAFSAANRGDAAGLDAYQQALDAGFEQWKADAETVTSLCE